MSKLISGKEAFLSHMDGKEVQWRDGELYGDWMDWHETTSWSSEALNNPTYQFRLKPRTIMIGDVEVPDRSRKYRYGKVIYVLDSNCSDGYKKYQTPLLMTFLCFGGMKKKKSSK